VTRTRATRPAAPAWHSIGLLFTKDLRLLTRSPALLAILVLYPVLISLLVAGALQEGERTPRIAIVNLDTAGRSVEVAGERLSVDDYIARVGEDARTELMEAGEAGSALRDGRVDAVITIPEGFVADLQSGLRSPVIGLEASRRSPIAAEALERRLEAAVFRLNRGLAEGYVEQVVALVDLVVNGGRLGLFGRTGEALGLVRSRELVVELQEELRAAGDEETAARIDPLIGFIDETRANLDLAAPAANAIRSPIELEVVEGAGGRAPLTAFGLAAALLVSIGLAGVLLGAAGLAAERDDNVLGRLRRGLVSPAALIAEKAIMAALVCTILGVVVLGGLALGAGIPVGRWPLWLPTLVLTGLALGALGTLAGALARETRTALLAALMLTVPLVALALLPSGGLAGLLAGLVPFGPAFDIMQALLVEPRLDASAVMADMA
jgi:ABC-type transport system involved in cytochrome c biogenesis permease component